MSIYFFAINPQQLMGALRTGLSDIDGIGWNWSDTDGLRLEHEMWKSKAYLQVSSQADHLRCDIHITTDFENRRAIFGSMSGRAVELFVAHFWYAFHRCAVDPAPSHFDSDLRTLYAA